MHYSIFIFFLIFTLGCKTNHDFYTSKSAAVEKKLKDNGCGCFAQMVKDHFFYDKQRQHYIFGIQAYSKIVGERSVYDDCLNGMTEEDFKLLFGPPQLQTKNKLTYFYSINHAGGSYNGWEVIINGEGFVTATHTRTYDNNIDFAAYKHLRSAKAEAKLYFADEAQLRVVQNIFRPFDEKMLKEKFQPTDFIAHKRPLYENDTLPYLCLKCLQYRQANWYRNTRTGIYILNTTQTRLPFISGPDKNAETKRCMEIINLLPENREMLNAVYGKPDVVSSQRDTLVYFMNAVSDRDTVNRSLSFYRSNSDENYRYAWYWTSEIPSIPQYKCRKGSNTP